MNQTPEAVWASCLEVIKPIINRQSYRTWFKPLKAISLTQDGALLKLTVQLPSRFFYEWLEEHYYNLLRKTITKVLGPHGRLYYNIIIERQDDSAGDDSGASMQLPARRPANEPHPRSPRLPDMSSARNPHGAFSSTGSQPVEITNPFVIPGIRQVPFESNLNASYTFDRFIEGDCNRLARSASLAIAEEPGTTSFNPFLIYGGVGLGKTHLIQAIGNFVRQNHQSKSVLYVSSERFTNDFVRAIQQNRVNQFSLFYRHIDVLVIDDVQFFGGKEKTQEEFFHIFNELHQIGKQIVLSADRPPREIRGIEERLMSRFQWGLTADLQPPELETRIAILNRKASDDGIEFAADVIDFIAHNVKNNIRELEGALIRLLAHATLHQEDIDASVAKDVLRDLIMETSVNLTIDQIQEIVCEYFDMDQDLVRAKTRKREVVQARQVAMYFAKQLTQHSLKTIGLQFGGRDHSTVIHANQSVNNQIETNNKFREMVDEIRHKIDVRSR